MGEVVQLKKKNNKKLYFILALLVLATVALLYVNLVHSAYRKSLSLSSTSIMSLEDSTYSFGKAGDNILVCGQEGLTAVNKNGEIAWKYSSAAIEPELSSNGEYALFTDLSGSDVQLIADGKNISSHHSVYDIITAKVNKSGYYAVASKERGYKSQVLVFSPKGEQVYAWHSTKYYVMDVAVTNDNKSIIVSALDFEGGANSICKVLYFPFTATEPTILDCGENNLISSLACTQSGILAVGDNAVYGYSNSGKTSFTVDFTGRTLQEFSVSDDFFALGLTKGSVEGNYGGSVVEVYNAGGTIKGSFKIEDEISFLDIDDKKVLVNSEDGAYILSDTCRLYGNLTFENEVREGLIFSGGKKLLLVNGSSVNVYDAK